MIEFDKHLEIYKTEGLPEEKFRKLADLAELQAKLSELRRIVQMRRDAWLEQIEKCDRNPHRYAPDQCEKWAQELAKVRRELHILEGAK